MHSIPFTKRYPAAPAAVVSALIILLYVPVTMFVLYPAGRLVAIAVTAAATLSLLAIKRATLERHPDAQRTLLIGYRTAFVLVQIGLISYVAGVL
jgi:hypothetical protein